MDDASRKMLEDYIKAFQSLNDFFKESSQAFQAMLEQEPDLKRRYELMVQQEKFAEQVDMSLADRIPFYSALWVCDTPDILIRTGCRPLPMLYTQVHLREAIHEKSEKNPRWHGLPVDKIKKLPLLISEPVMVMDSLTRNDSILLVTDEYDADNLPVVVSVRLNGEGRYELDNMDSNFITSVYGKDNFEGFFRRVLKQDKLLYISKVKSQAMSERWGLRLPELTDPLDFDIIIRQSRNIVNSHIPEETAAKTAAEQEQIHSQEVQKESSAQEAEAVQQKEQQKNLKR